MHARGPDDEFEVMPFEIPQEPEFQMGGGGLYGTAQDYIRFTQMILNRGTLGRKRVLLPETVQMMSENHIGELDCGEWKTSIPALSNSGNFFPGMKQEWGLGFLINTEVTPQGRSNRSLAWAGLGNTFFWIDPTKRVTGVFLTQIFPSSITRQSNSFVISRRPCTSQFETRGDVDHDFHPMRSGLRCMLQFPRRNCLSS